MTGQITIQSNARTITGRASKQLRKQGIVPAVIYGHGFKPVSVQVDGKEFQKVYAEAGETTIVYVSLDDQSYPTIIHDVARDASSDNILHVDFYKVRLDEKINAKIPVEIVGIAPAVKNFGGIMLKNINEIEVEGFPQDLPHKFTVDVSKLEQIGEQFFVKDLAISEKLKLKAEPSDIIIMIQAPISEEKLKESLETAAPASADEVEVIKKEKATEEGEVGEAPATEPAGPPAGGKEPKKDK